MLKFAEYLLEEKATKEDFGELKSDPKGKLHELLVGKHLNGGKHMDRHADIEGRSPKEVHDEIAAKLGGINSKQYKNFNERARKAAEDIKGKLGIKKVDRVQWTSKAGDMKRATGIDATQKQDDSDIVVTDHTGKHHGISLKVSNDKNPITLSNNGVETTYGGDKILKEHKQDILDNHEGLRGITNKDERKEWLRQNPTAKLDIKKRNLKTLTEVARNMHSHIDKMTPEQKSEHIRHIVLHAYSTPMEAHGHVHIRHFTGGGHDPLMEVAHPALDHEHILNSPEHITVHHKGTSVYYHHKGVPFAMQTAKFSSQSDPLSSLVVTGKEVKRKKDRVAPAIAPVAHPTKEVTSKDITKSVKAPRVTKAPKPKKAPAPRRQVAPAPSSADQQRMSTDGGREPDWKPRHTSGQVAGASFRGPTE
jgi:hypothetical protein